MSDLGLREQWRPIPGKSCYSLVGQTPWVGAGDAVYIPPLGLMANCALYSLMMRVLLARVRPHVIREATALDEVSAEDFFKDWRGERLRDYLLPMLCSAMNVATPAYTSVQHLMHILHITAFTARYGLPEGLEAFPRRLADSVPVRYETPISRVVVEGGRVVGVQLDGDGSIVRADHVILAVAPIHAAALLTEELGALGAFFDGIIATPQPIPVLFFDRPISKDVMMYMGDPRAGGAFWFAIDALHKVPEMIPSGRSIVTLWTQHPQSEELNHLSDAEVLRRAVAEMNSVVPGVSPDWIEYASVQRHAFSHPPYVAGSYRAVLDFMARADRLNGLSFVGDVFGGSYMESSVRSAEAAVRRAMS